MAFARFLVRFVASILVVLVVLGSAPCVALRAQDVPAPAQTPCEVIVSGRTSTLKSIVIEKVGQRVPKIYQGKRACRNTPGFDWYVSRHYALKANIGDTLAEHFLTLAELAYPHYVEVIGAQPPDSDTTRMAMVHAKDLASMQQAVVSDVGMPWVGSGGGVTLPASGAAYNYPSGSLRYHRNDLSLHEGMHLFELAVAGDFYTPKLFCEGVAHMLANHVYDPAAKQLTVAVFDKAPINNPIDRGLRLAQEKGAPKIEDLLRGAGSPGDSTELMALYTAFFWNDPERLMKWRLWRDELFRARAQGDARQELSLEIMRRLCGGSFAALEQEWRDWLRRRHNTFTHVDWGWEQWGQSLQSYGWPWDEKLFSQMNINFPPGRALPDDPWRMDYPRSAKSPLVTSVQLGAAEPSLGCLLDFGPAKNQGWAGLGLGVDGRRLLRVAVEKNRSLVIDGTLLGMRPERQDVPFEPKFLAAARKTGLVGLTVRIAHDRIEVTARSGGGPATMPTGDPANVPSGGPSGALLEMTATYSLTAEQRQDLLSRPAALLSRDARHEIIPYLEDRVPPAPDLSRPAPANPWRFAGDRPTYVLYQAAWLMGDQTPAALLALRQKMIGAMNQDAAAQAAALAAWQSEIPRIVAKLRTLDTPQAHRALDLIEKTPVEPLEGDNRSH